MRSHQRPSGCAGMASQGLQGDWKCRPVSRARWRGHGRNGQTFRGEFAYSLNGFAMRLQRSPALY